MLEIRYCLYCKERFIVESEDESSDSKMYFCCGNHFRRYQKSQPVYIWQKGRSNLGNSNLEPSNQGIFNEGMRNVGKPVLF